MVLFNTTAIVSLAATFFLGQILITYFQNPLRKIPAAHLLAPFTSLWIQYRRWRGMENVTLKEVHDRLGPIVCLGPEEISVNCVQGGIREVYAGGYEKESSKKGRYNWYGFFSNYGGVDNMFSMGGNKSHSLRKRMISNIYSKSVVNSSPALLTQMSTILHDRFLPFLEDVSENDDGRLNIYSLMSGTTMDVVTGYIFGLSSSSNLIKNPKQLEWFLDLYNSRRSCNFWPQEFPAFTNLVERWLGYRFAPKWVDEANGNIEKWTKQMCDAAAMVCLQEKVEHKDTPVVYQQLNTALKKEVQKQEMVEAEMLHILASEVLDHLAAGFDTSGITLTYVVHELSRNPAIQIRLQRELETVSPRIVPGCSPTLPDPKVLDALPLLHAVVWETLRLHSAIPGPQPRFTPSQGCHLGPEGNRYYVPGGVRVSASAGLLHANEEVYENAGAWQPDRWLSMERLDAEKRKDMESRWFWAVAVVVGCVLEATWPYIVSSPLRTTLRFLPSMLD